MRNSRLRSLKKRRLMVGLGLLAVALIPLAALAATDWWFLENDRSAPVRASNVVKEGEWSGHPWQLTAHRSRIYGLCVSVTPAGSNASGSGGGTNCAPFVGLPGTKGLPEMTITFLGGSGSDELPAYIAGPVIDKASTVEIRFGTGEVLEAPTFSGPASLGHVRFYATELPATIHMPDPRIQDQRSFIDTLAGRDSEGNLVACLASRTAVRGLSPLSDCE